MKDRVNRRFVELDCTGMGLGKIAQEAAWRVRGLDDLTYDPCNPMKRAKMVLIRNIDKCNVGYEYKKYRFHSGYGGGHKVYFKRHMIEHRPIQLFKRICWGQLPKNKSSRKMLSLIRVV